MSEYRSLDPEAIVATIATVAERIEQRFSGSGLSQVAVEILAVSKQVQARVDEIARPRVALRLGVGALVVLLGVLLVLAPFATDMPDRFRLPELVQVAEAGINVLVLVGGAVFFLITTETRRKRKQVLDAVHELRSLAHVVDMHQLAKDPQRIRGIVFTPTASSPRDEMDAFLLSRYLDYCSELFSLIGKMAALYSSDSNDPGVIAAVNEIEALTTGLSRKVWQKIMILQAFELRA